MGYDFLTFQPFCHAFNLFSAKISVRSSKKLLHLR